MQVISINSAPRSGSTWLQTIFEAHPNTVSKYQPLFSWDHKNCINEESTVEDFQQFIKDITKNDNEFINRKGAYHEGTTNHIPVFTKETITSLVMKHVRNHQLLETFIKLCPDIKIIGLIRNPCATINSFVSNKTEFKDATFDSWKTAESRNISKEEYFGYDKWKEVVDIFESLKVKYPDNIIIVQYENLVELPEEINKLFSFVGLSMTDSVQTFIKESHNSDFVNEHDTSVYKDKSVTEKWKTQLDPTIKDYILNDVKNTTYEKYL